MLLAKILVTASVSFFSMVCAAKTWNITVQEFTFLYNFISVQPGDTLRFIFTNTVANNRSVTESTLDKPCSPKYGGIDTGLMRRPHIYRYKVANGSNPIWFYSRNDSASAYDVCREYLMALAVNATPEQRKTFLRNIRNNDNIPVSISSCSGVKIPIQKMIAVVALFAGLLVV